MPVRNSKIQNYGKLVKTFGRKYRYHDNALAPTQEYYYTPEFNLPNKTLNKVRSRNINKGTVYPGIPIKSGVDLVEDSKVYSINNTAYSNIRIIQHEAQTTPVIVAYDESGYEIISGFSLSLDNYLSYFYTNLQEFDSGTPLYPAPKDMEIVTKSKNEPEDVFDDILIIFIGSGAIEILTRKTTNTNGVEVRGEIFHRFLSEGWDSKYGNEINKSFYTDVVIGNEKKDFIQGDENRNSALAVVGHNVIENTGVDAGNIANDILENLKFVYYTKPITSENPYAINTVFSFNNSGGSAYKDRTKEIFPDNVASIMNNKNNEEPILFNVFFEYPVLDDFDYLYFKFDLSTLLYLKDEDRSIFQYVNNNYTGTNFSATSLTVPKLSSKVIFDSIGLMDIRYYDQKLKKWMSTNIVQKSYYENLYDSTLETADPLGIVRDCIEESDSWTTKSQVTANASNNYNPFFDYSSAELIIDSFDETGAIDYSNVTVKIKIRDGFKKLISNQYITCDENTKLNYALTAVDNPFEIDDKSVKIPEVYGKKLLWLAVPPIIQHSGDENSPSLSQFKVVDNVFGPAEITINYGAPLIGKYPLDVFKILKSMWVE